MNLLILFAFLGLIVYLVTESAALGLLVVASLIAIALLILIGSIVLWARSKEVDVLETPRK